MESYKLFAFKVDQNYYAIYFEDRDRFTFKTVVTPVEEEIAASCSILTENTTASEIFSPIHLVVAQDLNAVLTACAVNIAACTPPPTLAPAYRWCSWYYYYNNFDFVQLKELLEGLKNATRELPLKYIQIDAGYSPALGDWLLESHEFPNGIKPAIDLIKEYGYRLGIWIGPFMVGNRSKLFREHPDWLLKTTD